MPILYWYAPYINCFDMASVSIVGIQVATQARGENRRCGVMVVDVVAEVVVGRHPKTFVIVFSI